MMKKIIKWHITAHPKGSTVWTTAWQYGLFDTQADALRYLEEQLSAVEDVLFYAAAGSLWR